MPNKSSVFINLVVIQCPAANMGIYYCLAFSSVSFKSQVYTQLAEDDKIRYKNEMKSWEDHMVEIGREDVIREQSLSARKKTAAKRQAATKDTKKVKAKAANKTTSTAKSKTAKTTSKMSSKKTV